MDVSCHSFLRRARLAKPLTPDRGCLLTVTFYGSEQVVVDYNLMDQMRAARDSAARHAAAKLADHHPSSKPDHHFHEFLVAEAAAAPEHQLVDFEDVGALAAFLVGDGARYITGTVIPVDSGQHLMALKAA
jgi:enoyl-[acyl-carrier protein] reductase I